MNLMNKLTGHHPHAARGHDLYETPACAVEALLEVEHLPHKIWEPCAGRGAIVDVLRERGHFVVASDLVDYGVPGQEAGADFLKTTKAPAGCGCVLTNPPFRLAESFVAHALGLVPLAIFLLRLSFLESTRRTQILEGGQLARVHIFRNRLPFMHRDGWTGPRVSSAIPFAWFVFSRDHRGPIQLTRISWVRS